MNKKVYKIRNKETGLFSKGGSYSYDIWTKDGKTWSTIGHLKSHLNLFIDRGKYDKKYPYENAEIVEVIMNFEDCFSYDVSEMMDRIVDKKAKMEEEYLKQSEMWKKAQELKQLRELQQKYPEE